VFPLFDPTGAPLSVFPDVPGANENQDSDADPNTGMSTQTYVLVAGDNGLGIGAGYFIDLTPVELVSFEAEAVNCSSVIFWTTATEMNSSHFILERSYDGVNFETIAEITAAGNSNEMINYSYVDEDVQNGLNYYRLVQVDFDGDSKAYPAITLLVNCGEEEGGIIISNLFPNPTASEINYVVTALRGGTVRIMIIDELGRVLESEVAEVDAGVNMFSASVAEMKFLIKICLAVAVCFCMTNTYGQQATSGKKTISADGTAKVIATPQSKVIANEMTPSQDERRTIRKEKTIGTAKKLALSTPSNQESASAASRSAVAQGLKSPTAKLDESKIATLNED